MPPSLYRLDDAYTAQTAAVRARVQAFTRARFAAGDYRAADLKRFLEQVVPVVLAARLQVAALTDAWLTQRLTAMLGQPVRSTGLVDTAALRGVAPVEVYARPFVTIWTALAAGTAFTAAVAQGQHRLDSLTATDLQLARTHQTQRVLESTPDKVTGYRRVLKGDYSCAMCVLASTQRYLKADLMPIHPGCDCGVAPLFGWNEHVLDPKLLERIHEVIRDRFGLTDRQGRDLGLNKVDSQGFALPDFMDVIVTHEHGELGPVLGIRGQDWTGPGDIAA